MSGPKPRPYPDPPSPLDPIWQPPMEIESSQKF